MPKLTQTQLVLNHLIDHGYITDLVAQSMRIRRLASRINELVVEGLQVGKEVRKDSLGQRYTYYTLAEIDRFFEHERRAEGEGWRVAA